MSGWTDRLVEIGSFRPPEAQWSDVWALIVRGQRTYSLAWVESQFWIWRFSAWVLHLDADPFTCRACGGLISDAHALSRYCASPCRKVAFRRRKQSKPTDFEILVVRAKADLKEIYVHVSQAQRSLRLLGHKAFTFPPDLARLDHLPVLPRRCGSGCEPTSTCTHTRNVCLFAATGEIQEPRDES